MKKQILIIVAVLLIVSIGIFFWAQNKLNNYVEDNNKSTQLSHKIQQYFDNGKSLETYPFNEDIPNWGTDYLVLEKGGSEISVRYNSEWNEKMQTQSNFPGEEIKGLVIIDIEYIDLGDYVNRSGAKVGKATQRNYVINYFDMDKRSIVAIDTLLGEEPSETKSNTGSGTGDLPKDELVVETIKKRIK